MKTKDIYQYRIDFDEDFNFINEEYNYKRFDEIKKEYYFCFNHKSYSYTKHMRIYSYCCDFIANEKTIKRNSLIARNHLYEYIKNDIESKIEKIENFKGSFNELFRKELRKDKITKIIKKYDKK